VSIDKNDYQPNPLEDSVAEQLERNDISEEAKRLSQGLDENDTRVSPAFEGFINVMVMTVGLGLIAFAIYGLIHWGS
jgi:hypothetical protein